MIKTKSSKFTQKVSFQLWLKSSFYKLITIFIAVFLIGTIGCFLIVGYENISNNKIWVLAGILLYDFSITIFIIGQAWFFWNSPKNKIFHQSFYLEIDDNLIKIIREDDSYSMIYWKDIKQAKKIQQYFILTNTSIALLHLSEDIFEPTDLREFKKILAEKNLLNIAT